MNTQLLACPFCGGKAENCHNPFHNDMSMVRCRNCGSQAFESKWQERVVVTEGKMDVEKFYAHVVVIEAGPVKLSGDDAAVVQALGLIRNAGSGYRKDAAVQLPEHVRSIRIPTATMEQEFQTHYRRGYEAGNANSLRFIDAFDKWVDAKGTYGERARWEALAAARNAFAAPSKKADPSTDTASAVSEDWPEYLMLRDTKLHDDMGGKGQRIYTTAGFGYEKRKYIREDLATQGKKD